jgi:hypothetical protein
MDIILAKVEKDLGITLTERELMVANYLRALYNEHNDDDTKVSKNIMLRNSTDTFKRNLRPTADFHGVTADLYFVKTAWNGNVHYQLLVSGKREKVDKFLATILKTIEDINTP